MQLDAELRERLRHQLANFPVQAAPRPVQRAAAVALAVCAEGPGAELAGLPAHTQWSTRAALILTKRSLHLRNHAGQWSLPGGRIDEGETPEQAALRELSEEVRLVLDESSVLGRLDDFVTRSGFAITPVVVWAGKARDLVANAAEVHSIHRIPIVEFGRADAPWLDVVDTSEHPMLRMPVGDTWIAAPTAAMLYQFRELCLHGRTTRVAHFEQPAFAWK
jgi:8-oxo-dGTP pyrophosphatase MutT (NUDIX family)